MTFITPKAAFSLNNMLHNSSHHPIQYYYISESELHIARELDMHKNLSNKKCRLKNYAGPFGDPQAAHGSSVTT